MSVAERMCDFVFMIFKGRKVLDGTLASIQNTYGQDTIRVRVEGNGYDPHGVPGVEKVTDFGRMQELRITPETDTQEVLRALMKCGRVAHFEQTTPSLHDIFVRIAGPEATETAADANETAPDTRVAGPEFAAGAGRAGSVTPTAQEDPHA